MKTIFAKAPTRIDFAGGTLDIPPLFLFHQPLYTINAAITIFTEARVTAETEGNERFRCKVVSRDQGEHFFAKTAADFDALEGHPLELAARFAKNHSGGRVALETFSQAPKGSGLGASSSLAVAIGGALKHLHGSPEPKSDEEFIEYVKGIETQSIRVPTGYQDYLAAYYGGVNIFSFSLNGIEREPIEDASFTEELERHIFLVYTGIPHFSGVNNWELFQKRIQGDAHVTKFFARLRDNAEECRNAFLKKDIHAIGAVMARDWEDRRSMIPVMSTPFIDDLIVRLQHAGAFGWRVCGAGGGGCIAFLAPPPKHQLMRDLLLGMTEDVKVLPCFIARKGLAVAEEI